MNDLGIAFTVFVILVSLGVHWRRRRTAATSCSVQPNLSGLQVSCLATQALGAQFFWREQSIGLPPATFAVICVIVGVAGLGYASIFCDCRNDVLMV
ncbi:MAG: hypothetical protein HZB51_18060 [Chloroflexi bacterium]|nr:hypothetical protein [Chloroflexota bacterium]